MEINEVHDFLLAERNHDNDVAIVRYLLFAGHNFLLPIVFR